VLDEDPDPSMVRDNFKHRLTSIVSHCCGVRSKNSITASARVTTHLENLEKSGNSKVVREKSDKMEKVREKSGKLTFVSSCNQYTSNTNRLSVKSVQYAQISNI